MYRTAANAPQKNQTLQTLLLVIVIQNASNRIIFGFPVLTFTFIILIRYGTVLVLVLLMKVNVQVISEDESIIQTIKAAELELLINICNNTSDPIEVVLCMMDRKPSVVVLDDDYLKPYSAKILKSIKQISENIKIIFLTSDNSVDLGREISQIGIYFYAIKPLTKDEILDLIKSVSTNNKSTTFS